ncbi:MAG: hypothetical protein ACRDHZ_14095 [Ktedonobacteraceae bacterium]
MIDLETFLTTLYVIIDDFCQSKLERPLAKPGPVASLSRSEVLTLALFGQWVPFPSERAFYRIAQQHLREAFPRVPNRSQFNRLQRSYRDAITAFALFVVQMLRAQDTAYEVLDSTAAVTRDAKRRGLAWAGWLVKPILVGATVLVGTKASIFCWR